MCTWVVGHKGQRAAEQNAQDECYAPFIDFNKSITWTVYPMFPIMLIIIKHYLPCRSMVLT